MEENTVIRVEDLTKIYNRKVIFENVTQEFARGKTVALVGENGCGKSTMLRILSGISRQSSGTVDVAKSIDGHRCRMAMIPDCFEKVGFTIPEYLCHMQKIEIGKTDKKLMDFYFEKFFLQDMLKTPMKFLSKGTLQKAAVIQALMSDCDVIFMDEPLSGQDYMSQANFIEEMNIRKENNITVIMSCHEPFLIESLADVIYQIKNKKLVDGTQYIYNKRKKNGVFILNNEKNCKELLESIRDKSTQIFDGQTTKSIPIKINVVGSIIRVSTDLETAKVVFREMIDKDIHIVKYEEV